MRSQLVKSVAIFAGANILAAVIPLLLLPILTRALTPADYGLVAMYSLVITAFGALTGLSAHGAVGMRYFDRAEIDYPRYVGNALIILLTTSAILFAVILVAGGYIEQITKLPRAWLLAAVVVSALQFVLLIRLAIFQSAKQAGFFAAFRLSQAIIDAGLSLALVIGLSLAWQGRLAGQSAGIGVLGLVSLVSLALGGWIKARLHRGDMSSLLRFGIPLVPHVIGGMLLTSMDRVLITNIVGVEDTGIYTVAVQIGLGLYLLADACNRAVSPWLIETLKSNDPARDVQVVRYTVLYFALLVIGAATVGIGAIWVLPLIVGPAFVGAARLIWIIAIAQAFAGMYLIVANTIFYRERTASLAIITITCGIFGVALSYVLLHIYGVVGAAIAQAAAQMAMFGAAFLFAQRLRPLPWLAAFKPAPRI